MQSRLVFDGGGQRTFVLVFDAGDELMAALQGFAREQGLGASRLTGFGALSGAVLGVYEPESRGYKRIAVAEQVELLSLVGTVALADGQPTVHAHVTLARGDGSALGGHLIEGRVRPTVEMSLTEAEQRLERRWNEQAQLKLIDLSEPGAPGLH